MADQNKIDLAYMCLSIVKGFDEFSPLEDDVRRRPSYPYEDSFQKGNLNISIRETGPNARFAEVYFNDNKVFKFFIKEDSSTRPVPERNIELDIEEYERITSTWEDEIKSIYASIFEK